MKRWIAISVAGVLAATMAVGASAASPEREEMRAQKEAFRTNQTELKEQSAANQALRTEWKAARQAARDEGELTREIKEKLAQLAGQIEAQRQALEGTREEIIAAKALAQSQKKAGDLSAASQAWEEAVAVQQQRIDVKSEIGVLLEERLALLP
ncbi:MAG: hypothetical protein DBX44_05345 [Oscillospiraceae bacterium]|nr:MAG: hypothetical protein DBX44_05345 [Oscillospiraceae bacterium]